MKRSLKWFLLTGFLFFSLLSAEMPPTNAESPDIPAVVPEACGETFTLRDGINTIERAGVYHITGKCTGQLVIDAKGAAAHRAAGGYHLPAGDYGQRHDLPGHPAEETQLLFRSRDDACGHSQAQCEKELRQPDRPSRRRCQIAGLLVLHPRAAGKEKLPLIVYLHGGSGKGSDLTQITSVDGIPQYLRDGKLGNVRAYVLIPQCPANKSGWQSVAAQVLALIDQVCQQYPVDTDRVILTGHSMGGTGTWTLGAMAPERFSCIVPMSGSISLTASKQKALSKVNVWAIVGEQDKVVPPSASAKAIEKLQKAKGNAKLTILPGAAHRDVPALAWLDPNLGLLDWMLAQ